MEHQFAQYNLLEMVRNLSHKISVIFSPNTYKLRWLPMWFICILSLLGKYVLSSGKDSLVKLWEMSTTRCLIAYTGAGATGKQVMIVYSDN